MEIVTRLQFRIFRLKKNENSNVTKTVFLVLIGLTFLITKASVRTKVLLGARVVLGAFLTLTLVKHMHSIFL